MKSIKIILLTMVLTLSSNFYAFNKNPTKETKTVSKQIEKLLQYSDIKIYDDIVITVKFKIDSNNKIITVSDNSKNIEISKFIKFSLNRKKLEIDKSINHKSYIVPVRFVSNSD